MSHISLVTSVHQGTALKSAAVNRTQLIYPDDREVGYTYDGDNRLVQVDDWNSGVTTYQYDGAGRLITTTLPNGVVSVNGYDDANRLLRLRHEGSDGSLLAEYVYQLDSVGNRVAVTETVRAPDVVETIDAYIEQNGLLVLEAENGTATSNTSHDWQTQTVQAEYEGSGYSRTLPDVGARYEEAETDSSSYLSWPIYNETSGTYSVWVRGMAPDAGGDSLHVRLDGQMPSSAADLTGFTDEWSWSKVTMSGGNATVDLSATGEHTLEAYMREDGLRVDRMLLVTDTNYIPSGLGPAESLFQTITETIPGGLGTTSIAYQYDALYRLTDATYSGTITASFVYDYDAVGNMTAFTETVDAQTTSVTRSFDAVNRLQTSFDATAGTTSYIYDSNGNLTEVYPPGSDAQNPAGALQYAYDQRNMMLSHSTNPDGTAWVLQAEYVYDGGSDRLQQVDYTGATPITTTYTNDTSGLTQVLVADDGTSQATNLFGLDLISQDSEAEVRTLLMDGLGSVRLEMVGAVVEAATTYSPYGEMLEQVGTSGTVYGFTGEQEDRATGLLYLRARYYSPALKVFQSRDPWEGSGWRPGTLNYYAYVMNNPLSYIDPTGSIPGVNTHNSRIGSSNCPIGTWDCKAVQNVRRLKSHFLDSAARHNRIPGMDDNGFAALIASTIVSERRIGRIDDSDPIRNRQAQFLEDLAIDLGCVVSGHKLRDALFDERDFAKFWSYFTNEEIPAYATVGIGNVHLDTAANLWRGRAVSSLGDITEVSVGPLRITNLLGFEVSVNDPFGPQVACGFGGACARYEPSELESYQTIGHQLLSNVINIEYVAANLEAGALRALANGFIPTAFNSASWHLVGVQTDDEFRRILGGWNPGGAVFILDQVPTALSVMELASSWNALTDPQYVKYKSR